MYVIHGRAGIAGILQTHSRSQFETQPDKHGDTTNDITIEPPTFELASEFHSLLSEDEQENSEDEVIRKQAEQKSVRVLAQSGVRKSAVDQYKCFALTGEMS